MRRTVPGPDTFSGQHEVDDALAAATADGGVARRSAAFAAQEAVAVPALSSVYVMQVSGQGWGRQTGFRPLHPGLGIGRARPHCPGGGGGGGL